MHTFVLQTAAHKDSEEKERGAETDSDSTPEVADWRTVKFWKEGARTEEEWRRRQNHRKHRERR